MFTCVKIICIFVNKILKGMVNNTFTQFNKKSLAAFWKISRLTLNIIIDDIKQDPELEKKFGKYIGKKFNPIQLQILSQRTGYAIQ